MTPDTAHIDWDFEVDIGTGYRVIRLRAPGDKRWKTTAHKDIHKERGPEVSMIEKYTRNTSTRSARNALART